MKIISVTIYILIISTNIAFAQLKGEDVFEPKLSGKTFIHNYEIVGKQYYIDNWVKSDILLAGGLTIKNKYLKYNGYIDHFVWVNENNQQIILDDDSIQEVIMYVNNEKNIFFKKIKIKNSNPLDSISVFAQNLSNEKIQIFVYRKVINDKIHEVTNANGTFKKTIIKNSPLYIFILPNGDELYTNKIGYSILLKAFPNSKKTIKYNLRNNKIKIRTEEDLIKANKIISALIFP